MESFSRTLARVRREAGYPTAYAFYHKNGGRKVFPFTYVHYLRFERGVSLPRPEWMPTLLFALRLPQHSTILRELGLSYLRGLLRSETAYQAVLAPLLAAAKEPGFPETSAARWRAKQTVHLSPEQFQALADDPAVYWCSEFLLSDTGSFSVEELSELTGFPLDAVRRAIAELRRLGLARPSSKGRFKSRHPGRLYSFPGRLPGMQKALEKIGGYWEKMSAKRGGPVAWRMELVRTTASRMAAFSGRLLETLDASADLTVQERAEDTGFFCVRAEVRKIAPF